LNQKTKIWQRVMSKSDRFQELDALRGLAASWVVLFHYLTRFDEMFGRYDRPLIGDFQFPDGIYGVYLFFMISGFVIFMTLRRCAGPLDFCISRFSRLYPAYWASLGITAAVALLWPLPGQTISLAQILINASMLQGFFYVESVDGVYWTLMTELSFYAVMFVLFVSRALRRIETVCWIWLGAAMLCRLMAPFGVELPYRVGVLLVMSYAQFFIAGIIFYLVRVEGYTPNRVCLLLSCLLVASFAERFGPETACIVAFFAIFHFCVTGRLRRLASSPLVWLGTISYSLYLTHQMIGYRVISALLARGLPSQVIIPITIGGALALAAAISVLIERPAMRFIRDWYRRLTSAHQEEALKSLPSIKN
jgi:peptidoglycan/LPS O-acetylase OafA/YrhL